jgi:hypothetical protein
MLISNTVCLTVAWLVVCPEFSLCISNFQELIEAKLLIRCRNRREDESQKDDHEPSVLQNNDSKTNETPDPGTVCDPHLILDPQGNFLKVTCVGQAAYKGGIDLDWAQRLYDDLKANLQVTQVHSLG